MLCCRKEGSKGDASERMLYPTDFFSWGAEVYNLGAFEHAMSVVLAHAPRTGAEAGASLDYDLQKERVTICATRSYR